MGVVPHILFEANLAIVTALFLFFTITYLRKAMRFSEEFKADFNNLVYPYCPAGGWVYFMVQDYTEFRYVCPVLVDDDLFISGTAVVYA
jgi:hypothetical protein